MDNPSFLGRGWAFPPAFIKGSTTTVALTQDADNIKESLHTLFSTRIGERLMEFGYGTQLKALAFGAIDAMMEGNIKDTISRAILLYERRITLKEIIVDISQSREGIILIRLDYIINQINDRSNYVYPFHLTEGTNLKL